MSTLAAFIGRLLIGAYFIVSGAVMLLAPAPSDALLTGAGFVSGTAIGVGIVELIGGLCLALGAMTRLAAIVLAIWSLIAVFALNPPITSPAQVPALLLQLVVIGGLLLVYAHSQIWWSWDAMRRQRRADHVALDTEQRVHDAELNAAQRAHEAELRAARAEGASVTTGAPVLKRRWF